MAGPDTAVSRLRGTAAPDGTPPPPGRAAVANRTGADRCRPRRWHTHPYNRPVVYRLAAASRWLPRRARLALARGLGRLAPAAFPVERAAVAALLTRATGAAGDGLERLVRELFASFAMVFADLVSTNRQPADRLLGHVGRVRGAEVLADLAGAFVCLTAHVGNWELAGRLLACRARRRTHVVVADGEAAALAPWVRRSGDGVRFVPRCHATVGVGLVAALRRGEVVAVQGDRALGGRGDRPVPFLGQPAPFPLGPFLLARAAGVPIVPAFCLLDRDLRYEVRLLEPLPVADGGEEAALRVWVGALEALVRERPTQWFNFFDLWDPPRAP